MEATDRTSGEPEPDVLAGAWRALAHRAAVAGGAAAAIVSLWHHVPLSSVALRGGLAWGVILVTTRLGWAAVSRALELEARRRLREAEADETNA